MYEYVDVRGQHPVYFKGFIAVKLEGYRRDITLSEARIAAQWEKSSES